MVRFARFRWLFILLPIAFGMIVSNCAAAGPFTNLVVFGDSLSDVGNISQATPILTLVPKTPGPYYWNGRFSNGPVYAETLASGLGLPALNRSTATGGTDYAYGGAMTTGTAGLTSLVVQDIDDQVNDYVSHHNATANTLYTVFAGANDMLATQPNIGASVGSLQTSLEKLFTDGARQFLVINLPPLGYTPRYNSNQSTITTYNTRSQQFNAALATMVAGFRTSHPSIAMNQLDVYSLVNDARANPSLYGLTNVTASAAPGLSPGTSSYNTGLIASNPNQYLFWDDLHPTAGVHAFLGRRALDLFFPPGDYNRNVASDAGDYVAYRKGLGTTYAPIDYNIWRAHFGQTTPGAGSGFDSLAATGVPEPGGIFFCFFAFLAPLLRTRRLC